MHSGLGGGGVGHFGPDFLVTVFGLLRPSHMLLDGNLLVLILGTLTKCPKLMFVCNHFCHCMPFYKGNWK